MTTIQQSVNGGHALKIFWNSKFLSYFDGASRYLLIETDFRIFTVNDRSRVV